MRYLRLFSLLTLLVAGWWTDAEARTNYRTYLNETGQASMMVAEGFAALEDTASKYGALADSADFYGDKIVDTVAFYGDKTVDTLSVIITNTALIYVDADSTADWLKAVHDSLRKWEYPDSTKISRVVLGANARDTLRCPNFNKCFLSSNVAGALFVLWGTGFEQSGRDTLPLDENDRYDDSFADLDSIFTIAPAAGGTFKRVVKQN